jgi:hypothetical protein
MLDKTSRSAAEPTRADPLRKTTERAGTILAPKAKAPGKVVGTIGRRS